MEAEEALAGLENEIKQLNMEQRQFEDDAAKLHRQRVSDCITTFLTSSYVYQCADTVLCLNLHI